jgi:hypothetical protein
MRVGGVICGTFRLTTSFACGAHTHQLSPESPQVYLVHIEETPWALVHDIFAKIQVGMEAVMVVWYVVSISPNMVRRWLQAREARRIAAIPPRKRLVPSAAGSAGHAAGAVGAGTRSAALSGAHHPVVKAPGKSGQRPRPPPPPGQHHRPESAAAAAGLEEGWLDHGVGYAVLCLWAGLHDSMLLWRLSTAIVAFFVVYLADDRNQINILWFAVLIFEVVPRSQAITFVLRAVRLGGEALIHTTCMTLVFVYAFAVGGFIVFPNLFQLRKPEVVDGTTQMTWDNHRRVPCNSVWKCMIVILDQGLRKEDVGEAMDKIPWPMQSWDGECEECPLEEVGVTCPMQKTCLPGYENLYSWPQSKLWLRIAYTFFFFCVISALAIQVSLFLSRSFSLSLSLSFPLSLSLCLSLCLSLSLSVVCRCAIILYTRVCVCVCVCVCVTVDMFGLGFGV